MRWLTAPVMGGLLLAAFPALAQQPVGILSHAQANPAGASRVRNDAVARRTAEFVRDYYTDETIGARIHDLLLRHVQTGRYANVSPSALPVILTEDIRSLNNDLHLSVERDSAAPTEASPPPPMPAPARMIGPVPVEREKMWERTAEQLAEVRRENFGIRSIRILPGNVGLLEIGAFPVFTREVQERYAAVFSLLQDTDALVIDLTGHGGGHGVTGAHLASYLLDREPFLMNRFYRRGRSTLETWSFSRVEAPGYGRLEGPLYGEARPVVLAISPGTISAGEAFTYDLKNLARVTLVGEKTAGAANPGRFFNIGFGYRVFIPQARVESPITRSNWEGEGIIPEIAAPMSQAVDRAHLEALKRLEQTAAPERRASVAWIIRGLEARFSPLTVPAARLSHFAGRYTGGRLISERDGKLIYRRADGAERELIPISEDVFAIGTYTASTRIKFDRLNGSVVGATFLSADGSGEEIRRE